MVVRCESNLEEHRERAGFTQEGLAQELGVSRQTIVNIERAINEPRVLLALAIAAAFRIVDSELLRRK
jgi:putative transcriptional regulator